jgi:2-methylcitrate dehydratase PrpD
MITPMTLSEKYAAFVRELEWGRFPPEVKQTSLDLFLDWFANAAAGFGSPVASALAALSPAYDLSGRALRAGDLKGAEPLWAALINAGAVHALEYDDSFRAGLYHPGAPVISAAFSAACRQETSGTALLTAMVGGYEVSLRLASAINPSHYTLWHTTGTVGSFGAAAASASILRLVPKQIAAALGLSGTQAAGLWEVLPSAPQAKNLHPAKAAYAGLLSALLAGQGIQGPPTIFEGPRGFFAATVPEPVDLVTCTQGLGEDWLMLDTTFKAYPVCGHAMTPIEASLKLYRRFDPADIESVEVRAHPVSLQVASERHPADEAQAKFSIPYCVAVALLTGRVGQADFSPGLIASREIESIVSKIELVPDGGLTAVPGRRPAKVTVSLPGGRTLSATAEVRKGDPEMPMSADEKRSKVIALIGQAFGIRHPGELNDRLCGLSETSNVLAWAEALREILEPNR